MTPEAAESKSRRPETIVRTRRSKESVALDRARAIIGALMTPGAQFPSRTELEGAWRAIRRCERRRSPVGRR
jgi:hypothetical protein